MFIHVLVHENVKGQHYNIQNYLFYCDSLRSLTFSKRPVASRYIITLVLLILSSDHTLKLLGSEIFTIRLVEVRGAASKMFYHTHHLSLVKIQINSITAGRVLFECGNYLRVSPSLKLH